MRFLVRWARSAMMRRRWNRRFPLSVMHPGSSISDDSVIGRYTVLFPGATLLSSTVGAYSYVQANTAIYNAEVGPFCSIATDVTIGLAAHPTFMVSTSPVFYDNEQPLPRFFTRGRVFRDNLPRTLIGADVWIGQSAMLKAGVTIGIGAVIGAGAIVTKDIAPYMIAGGNPCRTIRARFAEDVQARVLASRWWEMEDAAIEELADRFADLDAFLKAIEGKRNR